MAKIVNRVTFVSYKHGYEFLDIQKQRWKLIFKYVNN